MANVYTLRAMSLASRHGFDSGVLPLAGLGHLIRDPFFEFLDPDHRLSVEREAEETWREYILPDLINYLLVPRVPLALNLRESDEENPIRVTHINAEPVEGDYFATARVLKPYQVTIPWEAIGTYSVHRNDYRDTGRSAEALLVGLAADLSLPEISHASTTGNANLDGWRMLHSLRENMR